MLRRDAWQTHIAAVTQIGAFKLEVERRVCESSGSKVAPSITAAARPRHSEVHGMVLWHNSGIKISIAVTSSELKPFKNNRILVLTPAASSAQGQCFKITVTT